MLGNDNIDKPRSFGSLISGEPLSLATNKRRWNLSVQSSIPWERFPWNGRLNFDFDDTVETIRRPFPGIRFDARIPPLVLVCVSVAGTGVCALNDSFYWLV